MKELQIRWQRLVDEQGQTCDRCGATEQAVDDAIGKLQGSLRELAIDVVLEKKALGRSLFANDPLQSNRIWIGGKSLEEWLSATVGQSQCCSTCGDSQCRTVTLAGKIYDAIPAALIIKAGLLAAAELLQGDLDSICFPATFPTPAKPECCPPVAKCRRS